MKKTILFIIVFNVCTVLTVNAQYMGLVGDAATIGWTPTGLAMQQDVVDLNIFTFQGVLKAGHFKIHLIEGDWCEGQWINAAVANQGMSSTDYITTTGCDGPDNQWEVTQPGSYSIVVDTTAETITITALAYYPELFLVGDATTNGWDLDNATALTVDDGNPALFSWTGTLSAGEFKITTAKTFDDGWDWIHPVTQGQDFGVTSYEVIVSGGGTDYKWVVPSEEGYVITIDLENEIINIVSEALSVLEYNLSKVSLYPNPVSNDLHINMGGLETADYTLFDMNGRSLMLGTATSNNNNTITLNEIRTKGVLLLELKTESATKVFKIVKL